MTVNLSLFRKWFSGVRRPYKNIRMRRRAESEAVTGLGGAGGPDVGQRGARLDPERAGRLRAKADGPANGATQSFRSQRPLDGRTGELGTGPAARTPPQTVDQFGGQRCVPSK